MDPEQLAETCGTDPSWVCREALDAVENEFVARTADFVLAKPFQILLIIPCAWILNRILRRSIERFVRKVGTGDSMIARLSQDDVTRARSTARTQTIAQVLRSVASALV